MGSMMGGGGKGGGGQSQSQDSSGQLLAALMSMYQNAQNPPSGHGAVDDPSLQARMLFMRSLGQRDGW